MGGRVRPTASPPWATGLGRGSCCGLLDAIEHVGAEQRRLAADASGRGCISFHERQELLERADELMAKLPLERLQALELPPGGDNVCPFSVRLDLARAEARGLEHGLGLSPRRIAPFACRVLRGRE